MKAMKFKVKSPEHSIQIQQLLFKKGYKWGGARQTAEHTTAKYLFAEPDGYICFSESPSTFDGENVETYRVKITLKKDKKAKKEL